MNDVVRFAHHRPLLEESLVRGELKLKELLRDSTVSLAAGKTLIRAGTDHEFVYRLVSGWACRTRGIADGRDQIILVFLPGELFAIKSMFVSTHFDDVKILSDAVIERIHYSQLHEAFNSDQDIANRCIWQVVEEERRLHGWVFGLGQGSAEERLAMLLIDLRGRLVLSGNIERGARTFSLPLTQTQIADHLGITPVHVNRTLRMFREAGVVTLRDGEVTIHDLEELARRAYPLLDAYERNTPEYVGEHVIREDGPAQKNQGKESASPV